MIIDAHMHVFPSLFQPHGFEAQSEYEAAAKRFFYEHLSQPPRRADTHRVDEKGNHVLGGESADLVVSPYGRFTWRSEKGEYYSQFFPPYMERMECTPRQARSAMEYIGVDKAVLVSASPPIYGRLNEYYTEMATADCSFRGRFLALAHVELPCPRDVDKALEFIHRFSSVGFRGLFLGVGAEAFSSANWAFWDGVSESGLPIYISLYPKKGEWEKSFLRMGDWVSRYPQIRGVMTHAYPLSTRVRDDSIHVGNDACAMLMESSLLLEVSHPVSRGFVEEYPFPIVRRAVHMLVDCFGADRLAWGSDYPVVERFCTYGQSLSYLTEHCPFISPSEMESITGGNIARLFELGEQAGK